MESLPTPLIVAAVGTVTAGVLLFLAEQVVNAVRRRRHRPALEAVVHRSRWPVRIATFALVASATLVAVEVAWTDGVARVLTVASLVWVASSVAHVVEDLAAHKLDLSKDDNRRERRARTQLAMVRRVGQLIISVVGITVLVASWPEGRTLGASMLASAGLIGLVAGLAAQSTLSNVFAGLQLTFTDALRIDDVVVVEGEWGKIEEITLTYIVVAIWDDRRLVLPSSYFVSNPFQHWTRTRSQLLGSTVMRFDYTIDAAAMRAELERFLPTCRWYDGRGWALQVIDDDGTTVHVRALATAVDGPQAWELRCAIREHMLTWVAEHQPDAFPRRRVVAPEEPAGGDGPGHGANGSTAGETVPYVPVALAAHVATNGGGAD
ncbi:MAG: mechanosensitive ion channel family protein [Actinomycetota bacterium]|nr:mechanosensitive ion channel family protein [Actinomycetota bacterium]